MTWVRLDHVHRVRAKGRTYHYHRVTRERLPDEPAAMAARVAEINRQLEAPTPERAPAGSWSALIALYKAAPEFKQLAPKTRQDYGRLLDKIGARWGQLGVAGIKREHVLAFRDRWAAKPRTANYLVQVIRLLLAFAVDRGWRADNPALRPKLLRTGEGHRPWEEEEIAAFRAAWAPETVERVAFELALNTGQRGGDLVAMLRQRYRRGAIQVKQEKTGELVEIPAADDLVAVLEPWLAAHDHLVVLATPSGGAFKVDHFRHTMRDAYSAAGLPASCTTHGLRYTAAARLHELGLDWPTIGAITGHATAEMVRKYSEKKRRARLAVGRLNRSQREQAKDAAG